ncbi:hypothetical protein ACJX0J_019234, partial [Zea mays]
YKNILYNNFYNLGKKRYQYLVLYMFWDDKCITTYNNFDLDQRKLLSDHKKVHIFSELLIISNNLLIVLASQLGRLILEIDGPKGYEEILYNKLIVDGR